MHPQSQVEINLPHHQFSLFVKQSMLTIERETNVQIGSLLSLSISFIINKGRVLWCPYTVILKIKVL